MSAQKSCRGKGRGATWTANMQAELERLHGQMQVKQIAEHMGLSPTQVYSRMKRTGLAATRLTIKGGNLKSVDGWTDAEAAYFAGLVDGEGTVSCSLRGKYIRPYLTITNTSFDLMYWLKTLGMTATLAVNNKGNAYWKITTSGFGLLELLQRIRPFVKIRTRRYDILIEIIKERRASGYRFQPTQTTHALLVELKALNLRGSQLLDEAKRLGVSLTLPQKLTASLRKVL